MKPNLSKAGLSLEVEGSSTQVESPQITRAIKEITELGTETVRRGGDLRGEGSILLPVKHRRNAEASNRLETDFGRLSVNAYRR